MLESPTRASCGLRDTMPLSGSPKVHPELRALGTGRSLGAGQAARESCVSICLQLGS